MSGLHLHFPLPWYPSHHIRIWYHLIHTRRLQLGLKITTFEVQFHRKPVRNCGTGTIWGGSRFGVFAADDYTVNVNGPIVTFIWYALNNGKIAPNFDVVNDPSKGCDQATGYPCCQRESPEWLNAHVILACKFTTPSSWSFFCFRFWISYGSPNGLLQKLDMRTMIPLQS